MTSYCPVPGPVPAAPSNRDYAGGFAAGLMLKDLKLALAAAADTTDAGDDGGGGGKASTPCSPASAGRGTDFSGLIKLIDGSWRP